MAARREHHDPPDAISGNGQQAALPRLEKV